MKINDTSWCKDVRDIIASQVGLPSSYPAADRIIEAIERHGLMIVQAPVGHWSLQAPPSLVVTSAALAASGEE